MKPCSEVPDPPGTALRSVLRHRAGAAFAATSVGFVGITLAVSSPAVSAQPGETTSTLPVDSRQLGSSLSRPNEGMAPQDAGDPGGWLQVSLFFLICAAVLMIATAVWWQSRKARQRRDAAGFDPVTLAKATGKGVRATSGDAS